MSDFTITVVGTGVIGTSIGLALKQHADPPRLVTHDKELANAQAAVKLGAFDKAEWNLINACEQANLVVLALPLNGIRSTLEAIGSYLQEGVVVTDTTRNKVPTLKWVKELLPDHAHFVGGNPVVHPSGVGYKNATPDLFKERLYCLTPAPSAHEDAVQMLVSFVSLLGGSPFFLDAAEHDGLITATELLPNLLSLTLMDTVAHQHSWRELRKLAGGLFENISSGAAGDPDGMTAAFLENKAALTHWVDRYITQLAEIKALLTAPDDSTEALAQKIDKAVVARTNWLQDFEAGNFTDPELVSPKIENPGILNQMIGFGRFRKSSKKDDK